MQLCPARRRLPAVEDLSVQGLGKLNAGRALAADIERVLHVLRARLLADISSRSRSNTANVEVLEKALEVAEAKALGD